MCYVREEGKIRYWFLFARLSVMITRTDQTARLI